MAYLKHSKSAAVRARLDHPVVDGDGHWLEPMPIFLDYLRDVAGPAVVEKFIKKATDTTWYDITPEERLRRRIHRPTWWGEPAGTLDRATAMVPRLFYERLDDFGIDFCVLYTSLEGLFLAGRAVLSWFPVRGGTFLASLNTLLFELTEPIRRVLLNPELPCAEPSSGPSPTAPARR